MASRSVLVFRATSRVWRPWLRQSSKFAEERVTEETTAHSTLVTWKNISLFIAIPAVGYLTWKNLIADRHHTEQREHFPWPHLRIRNKPFPWGDGDKTLFHNPHVNPAPAPEAKAVDTTPEESVIARLWRENLFEDPDKRDEIRWDHLRRMQHRREEYLRKRRAGQNRIQPMDLFTEIQHTPANPWDSEIDN